MVGTCNFHSINTYIFVFVISMTLRLYSYKKKKLKYGTLKKLDQYKYNLLIQVQLTDTLCSITVLSPDPLNTR